MCDQSFVDCSSWADHSISEDHHERLKSLVASLGYRVQAQSFEDCSGKPDEIPTRLPRPLYDEQSAGTLQRRRLRLAFSRSIVSRAAIASQTAARELVLVDALSLETFEPFPRWSPIPGPVPAGFTLSEPRDKEGRAASPTPSEPRDKEGRAASPTPSERSTRRARSGARRRSGPPVSELGSIQESGVVSEGSGNEGDDDESEEHDDSGEEQDEEATTGAASTPPAITGVAS